jgi:hypothetical protein
MKEFLYKLLLVIVAALAPVHAVLISVGVLVAADLVTGVWAAIKRGEEIKSSKLRNSVSKLFIYQIALISGFLMQQYLLDDMIPIVKIMGGLVGLVEFKSILENANSITGTDLFKLVIQKLGSSNNAEKKD